MDDKTRTTARKPSVVFDLKMPSFLYRDDRGEAKTVGVDRPKQGDFKVDCLANLSVG